MRAFAFLAVILLAVSVAFAQNVFHPATQVAPGIFGSELGGGNYTFNNSLFIVDKLGVGTTAPSEKLNVNGSMRVDNATGSAVLFANATSGNVAIGTITNPGYKLYIESPITYPIVGVNIKTLNSTGVSYLRIENDIGQSSLFGQYASERAGTTAGVPLANITQLRSASSNAFIILTNTATPLIFATNDVERMRIDSSGNVGIGTTSPSDRLNVNGSLRVDNSTGSAILYVNSTSNNVGIGTTTPNSDYRLDVNGGATMTAAVVTGQILIRGAPVTAAGELRFEDTALPNKKITATYTNQQLRWVSEVNKYFVFNGSTGNFGIGTLAPSQTLTVVGDANITGNLIGGNAFFEAQDQKASGTAAQACVSGSWFARNLTIALTNEVSGASLSNNNIILPAGTYYATAETAVIGSGGDKLRLYNLNDSAALVYGLNGYSYANTYHTSTDTSYLAGRFTLTGTKTLSLQHYVISCSNLGVAMSLAGINETYTDISIWKIR